MENKVSISYKDLEIKLIELFEEGVTTYAKCSEVIRSKYKMGAERFTKQYTETHSNWAKLKKEAISESICAKDKDRLETSIMKKERALEILTEIAEGKTRVESDEIIVPSDKDRIGAISELAKYQGWHAPTKTANTDSSGNDVDSPLDTLIKKGGKIVING